MSSEGNATANGGCPVRDPRYPEVWPGHMVPVNAVLYTLTLVWVLLGAGLLVWFRNKPYLKERGFTLQLVAGVALLFEASVVFLRDAIGRDQFSCDAYLWLSTLPAPLFSGVVWIRLFLYHNQGTFAKQRFAADVDELQKGLLSDAAATNDPRSPAVTRARRLTVTVTNSNRRLMQSMSPAPVVSAILQRGYSRKDAANRTLHLDLVAAKALAGDSFGVLVMAIILIPFLVSIGYQYLSQTFYGRGCVGCILGLTEMWIFLGAIIVIVLLGVGMMLYWKMYRVPDPLWILRELFYTAIAAFVFTIAAIVIDLNNPGRIHSNGIISWGYLVVFGMSIGYTLQTHYAVYFSLVLAKRRERANSSSSTAEMVQSSTAFAFEDILANPSAKEAFTAHLQAEWSIENLRFYDRIATWEKSYGPASEEERKTNAEGIYKTFIVPGAPLEINISAAQRDPLIRIFSMPLNERVVSMDMFDVAKREVYKLMSTDSFNRFRTTKVYADLNNGGGGIDAVVASNL